MDGRGGFVVAWNSAHDGLLSSGVFARHFGAHGQAIGSELQVNYTLHDQAFPTVGATGEGGGFVVAWESENQDGSSAGVSTRSIGAGGAEVQVNTYVTSAQVNPSLAASGGGEMVVVWQDAGQDGDQGGVFGRRFTSLAVFDIDGDGSLGPLTDGLLALRFEGYLKTLI